MTFVFNPLTIDAQPPGVDSPPPVTVGFVRQQIVAEQQTFVGTLQPIRQVIVGTAVEGRIDELLVNPGDRITGPRDGQPGQVLARQDTDILQIEVDAAKIQLDLAERILEELELMLPEELALAEARLSETHARLDQAQKELERLERLASTVGAVAVVELELARSAFLTQQFLAKQVESDIRRLNATREVRQVQARLRVDAALQEIVRLHDQIERHQIRAPFDGYVIAKFTDVGAWATRGANVVELVQVDTMEMVFNLPQEFVEQVAVSLGSYEGGRPMVRVTVDGFHQSVDATIESIIPQADQRSRMFPIRCTFVNPSINGTPLFQPGMLARATLTLRGQREVNLVKKDALVLGGRDPLVVKIVGTETEPKAAPVRVQTGQKIGDWVEVIGDIQPGDRVVILGNERLRAGQTVRIIDTNDESPASD